MFSAVKNDLSDFDGVVFGIQRVGKQERKAGLKRVRTRL